MKARFAVILLLIGSALFISGSLFKFMHWPPALANVQLLIGSIFQSVAFIGIALKVLRHPGFKDFLDR